MAVSPAVTGYVVFMRLVIDKSGSTAIAEKVDRRKEKHLNEE